MAPELIPWVSALPGALSYGAEFPQVSSPTIVGLCKTHDFKTHFPRLSCHQAHNSSTHTISFQMQREPASPAVERAADRYTNLQTTAGNTKHTACPDLLICRAAHRQVQPKPRKCRHQPCRWHFINRLLWYNPKEIEVILRGAKGRLMSKSQLALFYRLNHSH